MKNIYMVEGTLNKDFVGQISYTICLDKTYKEMAIDFSFDKQYDERMVGMKTELQIIVSMNDTFIGGIHRQENPKHIFFSGTHATLGCIPQLKMHGVIRITIVAFSVILDQTNYKLSLSAC